MLHRIRVVQTVEHVYDIEVEGNTLDEAMESYTANGIDDIEKYENKLLGGCTYETVDGGPE